MGDAGEGVANLPSHPGRPFTKSLRQLPGRGQSLGELAHPRPSDLRKPFPEGPRERCSASILGWAAHLHDERPVLGAHVAVQVLLAVVGISNEDLGVQHGCVAQLGPVAAAQQPPGQLALVHHGGHHVAGPPQGTAPELEALQLWHRLHTEG